MKNLTSKKKDTRSGFGDGLTQLGKTNKNIVALCADLTGSLKMNGFKEKYPERFFQIGIAEANMMGIAAGMTIGGKYHLLEHLQIFQREEFSMTKLDNQSHTRQKRKNMCITCWNNFRE